MRLVCFSSPNLYNFSLVINSTYQSRNLTFSVFINIVTVFIVCQPQDPPGQYESWLQLEVCLFVHPPLMLDGNVHFVTLQHERRVKVEIAAGIPVKKVSQQGYFHTTADYKLVRVSDLNILQAQLFPPCSPTFNHFNSSCSLSQSLCGCFELVLCQFFFL